MALDINGYNGTFRTFVDFAQKTSRDGYGSACAKATLNDRQITVSALSLHETSAVLRKTAEKDSNEATRTLFRNAIIDMFGGEAKIPESVKKAMELDDYGKGRPLTARRIIAVKNAIDAEDSMRTKGVEDAIRASALAKGFAPEELPRLAKAVNYYMQATGATAEMALEVVGAPGTAANRLMEYGGRFLENRENFADGLRLLDLFDNWYEDLCNGVNAIFESGYTRDERDYDLADTPTKLNADHDCVSPKCRAPLERFIFEALAANPKANLREQDPEKLFGVKNNAVTSFVCQNFGQGSWNTILQMPQQKRAVVFKAFAMLCTIARNGDEAKTDAGVRSFGSSNSKMIIGRLLKNMDRLLALDARGKLTAKDIVKTCFPELGDIRRYELRRLYDFLQSITSVQLADLDPMEAQAILMTMEATGCSVEEVRNARQNGTHLPTLPDVVEAQMKLSACCSPESIRAQMELDLIRPANYSMANDPAHPLIADETRGFGLTFTGGERLVTRGTDAGIENAARVTEKIRELCGSVHSRQICSVMSMLSQSGMSVMIRNLEHRGIAANEHGVLDFAITKDELTGDIHIRYSSPADLKFAFEWSATVKLDGTITTTPFKFTGEDEVKAEIDAASAKIKAKILESMIIGEGGVSEEDCDNAVKKLVKFANGDRALLKLLAAEGCDAAKHVLKDFDMAFRTDGEISRRLEKLRDNVNELRMASGGDDRVFTSALRGMAKFKGRPQPPGVITKLLEGSRRVNLSGLAKIKGDVSIGLFASFLCQMLQMLGDIARKFDVRVKSGDESAAFGTFILSAMLARCDDATIQNLHDAIYSGNSGTVAEATSIIATEGGVHAMEGDEEIFLGITLLSNMIVHNGARTALDNAVNNILGIEQFESPPAEGPHKIDVNEVATVYTAIKHHVPRMFPDGDYKIK